MSDDKLTSDEVFDILKGSMPIALAGYLMDAVHPLGREGLEMVQAVREAAAAEERIKVEAQAAEIERLQYLNDLNAVPAAIIEDRGRAEERAKIVAWLRSASNGSETVKYGNLFADEIETGEHLK